MEITVKIGVAKPEKVNLASVAEELPYGSVTVETCQGGLNVPSDEDSDEIVISKQRYSLFSPTRLNLDSIKSFDIIIGDFPHKHSDRFLRTFH